jgi:hypothetical protein
MLLILLLAVGVRCHGGAVMVGRLQLLHEQG